jgi:hypothetical protein
LAKSRLLAALLSLAAPVIEARVFRPLVAEGAILVAGRWGEVACLSRSVTRVPSARWLSALLA